MQLFGKLLDIKTKHYLRFLSIIVIFKYLIEYFRDAFIVWNYGITLLVLSKIFNVILSVFSAIVLKKIFDSFINENARFFSSKYINDPVTKIISFFDIILFTVVLIGFSDLFDLVPKELSSDLRTVSVTSSFAAMLWEIFLRKHHILSAISKFLRDVFANFKVPEFVSAVFSLDFKFLIFFGLLKSLIKILNSLNSYFTERQLFLNNRYLFGTIDFFILVFSIIVLKRLLDISVHKINKNLSKNKSRENLGKSNFLFLVPLISNAGKIILAVIFTTALLNILGYSLFSFTSQLPKLIGSLGILGIGLSFMAQDAVANFIAGIFILTDSPFVIGDRIQAGERGEVEGEVEEIGIRTTKLRTRFNTIITVPNSLLTSKAVTSFRKYGREMRIFYELGVSYKSDVSKVKEVLMRAAKSSNAILKIPEPLIHLSGFDSFSMRFTLIFWVEDVLNRFEAHNDLNTAIVDEFKKEGLKIPYPIYDVNIRDNKK